MSSWMTKSDEYWYQQGRTDTLQEIKQGIEKLIKQYEADKDNVPKPDALSIYAYVVALEELL